MDGDWAFIFWLVFAASVVIGGPTRIGIRRCGDAENYSPPNASLSSGSIGSLHTIPSAQAAQAPMAALRPEGPHGNGG
jgi:hypothetical protein